MTSKFDPDGLVKRRTLGPSQSGIGPARDLEGVAGQNSCFLRSQPPDAPAPPACGPAARERARCPRLPLPPPMGGSSPLHLLLGPAAPATGVGGRPGPGSALGPPPSRQRPPWGCWAWWWWLEGVEPPVTGLYGLHTLVIPELGACAIAVTTSRSRGPEAAQLTD